jgi:dTDP-4-dehydrorhamnose reductase
MILVTGGNGQLAQCIKTFLPDAKYVDVEDCDITNLEQLQVFFSKEKPSIVINCAAFTHVDKCEEDIELSIKVNKDGAKNLALNCKNTNAKLLHISTDYVFNGIQNIPYKETDKTEPTSIYGKGKLEGEQEVINSGCNYIIIRTSWLYSEFGNNFVKNIKRLMSERDKLGIVFDQVGSPTYAIDLANAISEIIKDSSNFNDEVYHYSNTGIASWFDLTKEVQSFYGIKCDIGPIESHEYPTPAKRPHYSVFNTNKIRTTYNITIPYWKESLKKCLEKLS